MHIAQRFERLLDAHRRSDGGRWTGQQLDEATGGVVTRSYVTNLRKGRIDNPGYEKMLAIAKAMGFPPEAWFEDMPTGNARDALPEGRDLAARVKHLFDTIVHPRTGEPYTNAEVARMSAGLLTEEDVEGIRTGRIADPTVKQVAALAAVFGVEPSYLVDRKEPLSLDAELLEGLRDETTREITCQALRLPERARGRSSWASCGSSKEGRHRGTSVRRRGRETSPRAAKGPAPEVAVDPTVQRRR